MNAWQCKSESARVQESRKLYSCAMRLTVAAKLNSKWRKNWL